MTEKQYGMLLKEVDVGSHRAVKGVWSKFFFYFLKSDCSCQGMTIIAVVTIIAVLQRSQYTSSLWHHSIVYQLFGDKQAQKSHETEESYEVTVRGVGDIEGPCSDKCKCAAGLQWGHVNCHCQAMKKEKIKLWDGQTVYGQWLSTSR